MRNIDKFLISFNLYFPSRIPIFHTCKWNGASKITAMLTQFRVCCFLLDSLSKAKIYRISKFRRIWSETYSSLFFWCPIFNIETEIRPNSYSEFSSCLTKIQCDNSYYVNFWGFSRKSEQINESHSVSSM